MARAKQPVSINGIEFDALIDQSISYEADVPEYPTEKGFNVSDNITVKARTISMTLYVTDTPVTWAKRFGASPDRVESVVKQLEQLYFAKKVITAVTSDAVYENVVITSLSISKSADTGYAREIPITLKEITVVESKTVTIPSSYGKSGKSSASAGTASTTGGSSGSSVGGGSGGGSSGGSKDQSGSGKNGSILYNVASNVGLIK